MIEFEVDAQCANRKHQERDVGIHEPAEDALTQGHREVCDVFIGSVQRCLLAVEASDSASVQLVEQVVLVFGDNVNELVLKRLIVSPRLRLANGTFGYL